MVKKVRTWGDLEVALSKLSAKQKAQPIQTAKSNSGVRMTHAMKRGIALGTMSGLEFYAARSVTDNKFHPEEVVLLVTDSDFGTEDGAVGFEILSMPKNSKKKLKELFKLNKAAEKLRKELRGKDRKIYSKTHGKTKPRDQINPKMRGKRATTKDFEVKHLTLTIDAQCERDMNDDDIPEERP